MQHMPIVSDTLDGHPSSTPTLSLRHMLGGIRASSSPRSREYAPTWPGKNREPAYQFQGNGEADGGKAMRGWMKQHGVSPTQQMKSHGRSYDFKKLEQSIVKANGYEEKPDITGAWPPTNTWVDAHVYLESDVTDTN